MTELSLAAGNVGTLIGEKKYFKMHQASSLIGVKPHVLRYWESEFPQVRSFKSRTGQRLYRLKDIETFIKIQKLLYEKKYTMAGVRKLLESDADLQSRALMENVSETEILSDNEVSGQLLKNLAHTSTPEETLTPYVPPRESVDMHAFAPMSQSPANIETTAMAVANVPFEAIASACAVEIEPELVHNHENDANEFRVSSEISLQERANELAIKEQLLLLREKLEHLKILCEASDFSPDMDI